MVLKGAREEALRGDPEKNNKSKKKLKGSKKASANDSSLSSKEEQHQQRTRNEVLRAALASAFSTKPSSDGNAGPPDVYGKGSPTDRLQFGYAPSVTAEAVAYHSTIPTEVWIAARRKNYRTAIIKQKKLPRTNCEPITSIIKLRQHWRNMDLFEKEVHCVYGAARAGADDILENFAARQRTT
uniref:Uncharacterized protein TCIL3000_11_11950 n=1 Tax=Trypanosoma congolense (strain IL3000) TaxID=1068625 RepID=G0V231_TRYCI|nr:unnamed protein product [Trypanosoma congolense IL3000]